jgi:DNA-binding transcriptional MerR regulator
MGDEEQGHTPETAPDSLLATTSTDASLPPGRLLGRAETARLLGVSKSTLRRMEGGALAPVVGPKNVRLFQEEHVQALVVTRRSRAPDARAPGDTAADAFELFDKDVHPVEVVKQLRVPPDLIESLHQQWARLRGLMVLSHDTTLKIQALLCDGEDTPFPKNEATLLELTKKWVRDSSVRVCVQCTLEAAEFCRPCAKAWGLQNARNEIAQRRAARL